MKILLFILNMFILNIAYSFNCDDLVQLYQSNNGIELLTSSIDGVDNNNSKLSISINDIYTYSSISLISIKFKLNDDYNTIFNLPTSNIIYNCHIENDKSNNPAFIYFNTTDKYAPEQLNQLGLSKIVKVSFYSLKNDSANKKPTLIINPLKELDNDEYFSSSNVKMKLNFYSAINCVTLEKSLSDNKFELNEELYINYNSKQYLTFLKIEKIKRTTTPDKRAIYINKNLFTFGSCYFSPELNLTIVFLNNSVDRTQFIWGLNNFKKHSFGVIESKNLFDKLTLNESNLNIYNPLVNSQTKTPAPNKTPNKPLVREDSNMSISQEVDQLSDEDELMDDEGSNFEEEE